MSNEWKIVTKLIHFPQKIKILTPNMKYQRISGKKLNRFYLKTFIFWKCPTFVGCILGWSSIHLESKNAGRWNNGYSKALYILIGGRLKAIVILSPVFTQILQGFVKNIHKNLWLFSWFMFSVLSDQERPSTRLYKFKTLGMGENMEKIPSQLLLKH